MATAPATLSPPARPRALALARLLEPRWAVPGVVLAVSAIELAIADRKYGVFTGGFGQANAVDTAAERIVFLAAYGVSQLALALSVWCFCAAASRGAGRQAAVNFAFLFGGGMLAILVGRYQLHSYFSDALDFALLKNLGGGSLKDALLFGKTEIALALAALALLAGTWWLCGRLLRRLPLLDADYPTRPRWTLAAAANLLWLLALAAVARAGDDEARGLQRMVGWSAASTLAARLTDFDGDGYGLFGMQLDHQPFDGARHPLALDVPGNGIDEDGYGGDLALVAIPEPRPDTVISTGAPNLVLVVLESTRAEAIGKRLDGKLVAPHLTALAHAGAAISPSYSHVGFTTASLKSIFAGDLAPEPGAPSLFSDLKKSGYRIAVFSGQPEDFGGISHTVGMRSHADTFIDAETLRDKRAFSFAAQGSLLVDEQVLLAEFDRHFGVPQAWVEPQFVYLNFQSPHFPYDHPGIPHRFADPPLARSEIEAGRRDEVERTYWNAVAHADAALGGLIARLKAIGEWDDTILLVTGDHGEALFEDGFLGHGHIINQRQFATFLVMNRPLPGVRGPVAISDYRALLLDLLGGLKPASAPFAPFMHIGELGRPSTIGMAGTRFGIVSLRLDRGEACFERPRRCRSYDRLTGEERRAIDGIVARWGSERWARNGSR